ncbi:acyl carrier protein [Mycobacterium sp. NPDC050853]|uniref:phosphopantetheine-binding protein n=1 Tax=Mycobacteriaceae TaxID=1762 RepID=UPI0015DDC268|nr:acyl carrier protein [Mycobacteroides sp. LB1]
MTEIAVLPSDMDVIDALRDSLTKLLPPEDLALVDLDAVDANTPLLSLPIDSVVLMALMNDLEDRFTAFIPEEEAFAFTVVGDIGTFIRQRLRDKAIRREQA